MQIAFRVDASVEIGTGHIMRCLTLADALQAEGARCLFVCRAHPGHLADSIRGHGHALRLLPAPAGDFAATPPPVHAHWLGTDQASDARDTIAAIGTCRPQWLVVDHYALDARWEGQLRRHAERILVLDDLADRPHDCDLLLDPGIGRRRADYAALLPAHAQTLLGPEHALLRPEFRAWRPRSMARRRPPQLQQLLIAMGGVDKDNATTQVLDALDRCALPEGMAITVVLGRTAPWLPSVRARAAAMQHPVRVLAGVDNMAELMTQSDLAIGAAGSTSWERCCLGLPTLILVLAANQQQVADALAQAGAGLSLGRVGNDAWPARLHHEITRLRQDPQLAASLSRQAAALCDGNGARRAAASLCPPQFSLRAAVAEDARCVWDWRYTGVPAEYYQSAHTPSLAEHQHWFAEALRSPARQLLMLCRNGEAVCHLRLDTVAGAQPTAEVSICVAPDWRGLGVAGPALRQTIAHGQSAGIRRFVATVHHQNRASIALFRKCGFIQKNDTGTFLRLELDTGPDAANTSRGLAQ